MPPRARNDVIDYDAAKVALSALASLRDVGFDWAVLGYGKSRRSQGPDKEGIIKYFKLLHCILLLAPRGYPSLVDLRHLWCDLDRSHCIKDVKTHLERLGRTKQENR